MQDNLKPMCADVPAELEWFANLRNAQTRRAYKNALQDFMAFTGIARPASQGAAG